MAHLPPPIPLDGDGVPQPNLQTFAAHLHSAAEAIHRLGNHIEGAAALAPLLPEMLQVAPTQWEATTNMLSRLQAGIQDLQAEDHKNSVDTSGLQEEAHHVRANIQGLQAGLNRNRANIEGLQGKLHQSMEDIQGLQEGLHKNKAGTQVVQAELQQTRAAIEGCQAELHQEMGEIQGLRMEVHQAEGNIKQMQTEFESCRAELRQDQDLFIARLINGRVHGAEEIRYPPHIGGDLLAALPRTVEQLCNFTVAQCEAARTALGLPEFLPDIQVTQGREKIAEHLGLCLPAH